jgi:hypothetical protein
MTINELNICDKAQAESICITNKHSLAVDTSSVIKLLAIYKKTSGKNICCHGIDTDASVIGIVPPLYSGAF